MADSIAFGKMVALFLDTIPTSTLTQYVFQSPNFTF